MAQKAKPKSRGPQGSRTPRPGQGSAGQQPRSAQQAAPVTPVTAMPTPGEPINEPLLPVERRLIIWSLALGVALLLILIVVSYAIFPGSF